jgi:hypothetical protein
MNPILDFKPLFYILDKCQNTVLAAREQDRYEVKGVYVRYLFPIKEWEIWPACFNNQEPWEFPDRYEIISDEHEAWFFAEALSTAKPLNDEQCLLQYPRAADFPKY